MKYKGTTGLKAATALFGLLTCFPPARLSATQALCAVTQLQLSQQATLEREAFSAQLVIANTASLSIKF